MSKNSMRRAGAGLSAALALGAAACGGDASEEAMAKLESAQSAVQQAQDALSAAQEALDEVSRGPGPSTGPLELEDVPLASGSTAPLSSAVIVGDVIYLSGKLGLSSGEDAENGIEPETTRALDTIKAELEEYGSSMERVVKCTVFLVDMEEWPAMNEIYRTYFPNPPARSAVGVSALAADARVEIECIGIKG